MKTLTITSSFDCFLFYRQIIRLRAKYKIHQRLTLAIKHLYLISSENYYKFTENLFDMLANVQQNQLTNLVICNDIFLVIEQNGMVILTFISTRSRLSQNCVLILRFKDVVVSITNNG